MTSDEKIAALRALMSSHAIDAWIVPSADPHQSEYVAERWQARAWMTGFSGSAGTLVVTNDRAGLWTDSRYHLRAEQDLAGTSIELFKDRLPGVPSYMEWLAGQLPSGATVGFDGNVFSVSDVAKLSQALADKKIALNFEHDLIGQIWADRPDRPAGPLFLHDIRFSGESRAGKLARIRDKMLQQDAQVLVLAALDDIAWTLNIRGSDVTCNPVAVSYAVITGSEARLFVDADKVPADVSTALTADGVTLAPYEAIEDYLQELPAGATVLIDPDKTSYRLAQSIAPDCEVKQQTSLARAMKVVKNATELDGIRQAHVRDGIAMVKWLRWLETEVASGVHTEVTAAAKLEQIRSEAEHYQGLSFSIIAGYAANGAIGHYKPEAATAATLHPQSVLVVDSGSQYLDGTTDVTRTVSLGSPTAEQRRAFTRVLQSLIGLATAQFPQGTTGVQLDALARAPLWAEGWECRHGIGHGVGHFLNVHEGPPRFSPTGTAPIEPGMVMSIEPGVYFEGRFGIRIENMVIVAARDATEFGNFHGFETVTLCPIDLSLVDFSLLSRDELAWLNSYHQCVFDTLAPHLAPEEREWLRHKTRRAA